jgi:acyl-CoA ligase (AMP-forming) (exosortase A-associated)
LFELDPTPRPLDHLVTFGLPDRPALVSRDVVFNYGELDRAVGRFAAALLGADLEAGDRVASWLPKTAETCLMPMACARAGLIHVPINPQLKRAQVEQILSDSGAKLLVTAKARADTLNVGSVSSWLEDQARLAWQTGNALGLSTQDPQSLAAILYTSGSTGQPKGVMLSHANMWLGAISVSHYLRLSPDDRTLCVLPLSFDYGQNQLFSTWAAGGCAISLDYLTPRDVIRAVERHDITTLAGVPPLWVQLVESDWPEATARRIKRVTNSGGALSPKLIASLQRLLPDADVYPMYGLTEAFRSTFLAPELVSAHPLSMGKAIPFAEILVVRPDGSVASDDEAGELVHCGPLVAAGYWNDAERTAQRFKPAPIASRCGGTAVWSGDTVRRDGQGLHYFVGRDDEMIKVSGNRISPTEIEEAALASGLISEAVAIGVPDDRLGQSIILVVRGFENHDLLTHFKLELPSFMVPKQVIWKAELPRNANGKLDRSAIRAEVLA